VYLLTCSRRISSGWRTVGDHGEPWHGEELNSFSGQRPLHRDLCTARSSTTHCRHLVQWRTNTTCVRLFVGFYHVTTTADMTLCASLAVLLFCCTFINHCVSTTDHRVILHTSVNVHLSVLGVKQYEAS